MLYWEKVNFGLKPTFRIVQRVVCRQANAKAPVYAVAEKQLYASHYFQTALDEGMYQRRATARILSHNPQGLETGRVQPIASRGD